MDLSLLPAHPQKLVAERLTDAGADAALQGGLLGGGTLPSASRLPAQQAARGALQAWALWAALKPRLEATPPLPPPPLPPDRCCRERVFSRGFRV